MKKTSSLEDFPSTAAWKFGSSHREAHGSLVVVDLAEPAGDDAGGLFSGAGGEDGEEDHDTWDFTGMI